MTKFLPRQYGPFAAPLHPPVTEALAGLLRLASRGLARLARRLHPGAHRHPQVLPALEFYAEAGAPEGALYLDGELVGRLPGVQRL
ncbi:MAG: hypothetical protein CFE45_01800 [Burkholderiales bacterium PBB5]|nr:MAG: hypothetical protein CFE45_01800 [Burkholderiales bacterium PBB5]